MGALGDVISSALDPSWGEKQTQSPSHPPPLALYPSSYLTW